MTSRFPFGAPLLPCPPTKPASGTAKAMILGVYPSALHVRWKGPDGISISALAVDNEPSVFWDGSDQNDRIDAWSRRWFDPSWGTVTPTRLNGSSGIKIDNDVLAPLGLERADVWFTDAVNTYFVKSNDSQGKAHDGRFREFAERVGLPLERRPQVPQRPSPTALAKTALTEHRQRLLSEVDESGTPLIVTLGNEALATLAGLVDDEGLPSALDPVHYGERVTVRVSGRTVDVLALKHPGNRGERWSRVHHDWMSGPAR